jgi:ADP-heptose:LPS heptosyltransferase
MTDHPVRTASSPRFEGVHSIAVLRGGGLGDVIFAVPAVESLAAAYPDARITVLGAPIAAALLPGRLSVDVAVTELPFAPGIRDGEPDEAVTTHFFERLRGEFDLAVQVHGGGRNSNPFLLRLGARHTVGTRTEDAAELERSLPYVYYQHEVLRALEVVGLAGAAPVVLEPRVHPLPSDLERARELLPPHPGPTVVIHPGATDPRRRWPAERFGAVAAALLDDGHRVAVVGEGEDVELAEHIRRLAPDTLDLSGILDIGGLVGVLASADLMIGNDSGPRHLADAVGTPTASVFLIGNVINAAPPFRLRHRVQMSWTSRCPVCGRDATQVGWTAERCEHDPSFVADVAVEDVLADARALTARSPLPRGR